MNHTIDTIKNRRSIRKYTEKPVAKEDIDKLIDAGVYAPSSHNRQPWNFVIITNKSRIDELSVDIKEWYDYVTTLGKPFTFIQKVKKSVEEMRKRVESEKDLFFYHAPAVVLVHAKSNEFSRQDCAACAQNMLLAARSMEIGSCWIGFADIVFNRSKKIKTKYGVPASHNVMATLVFGHPEKFPGQALPRRQFSKVWIE